MGKPLYDKYGSKVGELIGSGGNGGCLPILVSIVVIIWLIGQMNQCISDAEHDIKEASVRISDTLRIERAEQFREGGWTFIRILFSDPRHEATGFTFRGSGGARKGKWEENHLFTSPSDGRVLPGKIEYPFNTTCNDASSRFGTVETWIYDRAGRRSPSITICLYCYLFGKPNFGACAGSATQWSQGQHGSQGRQKPVTQEAFQQPSSAPKIVRVESFRKGVLVFFRLFFTDPNNDAAGFGFRGVNGAGWVEENHPFSSPSYGRVSPGRIEYPFNHGCGTGSEYESDVEAWIYDRAGLRSPSITVHLECHAQRE